MCLYNNVATHHAFNHAGLVVDSQVFINWVATHGFYYIATYIHTYTYVYICTYIPITHSLYYTWSLLTELDLIITTRWLFCIATNDLTSRNVASYVYTVKEKLMLLNCSS